MTLAVDTSSAVRTVSERQLLVRAIKDAPLHEPETDAVEWKGVADLREKKWQVEIARQVIGFANRHPARAGTTWGGCAYLVIGVQPGEVHGLTPVDSAALDDTVSVYAGTDGPKWSPDFVEIDGKVVLVITVEPPLWGAPIFALRKTFEGYVDGDVYVRRNGKTERANHQEMRMLSERAAVQGERLGVDLDWWESPGAASALDLSGGAVERWIANERRDLLDSGLTISGSPARTVGDVAAEMRNERERPAHEAKVEQYLTEARPQARALWVTQAVNAGLGSLDLALVNLTDHNFTAVEVVLEFSGDVWSAFDRFDIDTDEFPTRPKPWSARERQRYSSMGSRLAPSFTIPDFTTPIVPRKPRGHSSNGGSTTLRFAAVDVRPGYRHHLGPVHVIASAEYEGTDIEGRWHATSSSASGVAQGVFPVPVSARVK